MTRMYSPTRTLMPLLCVALSLFYAPLTTSRLATPIMFKDTITIHSKLILTATTFAILLPQGTNAYAIPEVAHLLPDQGYQLEKRERVRGEKRHEDWTPDCTTDEQTSSEAVSAIVAGHTSLEPVTVTVTVGLPNTTYTSALPATSGSAYGSPGGNGTLAEGSTSASPTRTGSSDIATSTVIPILASAQEAQRLNAAFQTLQESDACTRKPWPIIIYKWY
ncbi:hypothetical protein M408DRAFT_284434 [Serendipita vermifera MAFF 305830]|uniref:Uncharacterized protein n=1 Tax=Serendipita vermifera MAFF 305830 TaxID=933852 RepID=A0A0C2W7R1_SERVB|nr:hypothetical protein M408DRAFT_284434 [Serendipita vermifera MAFF 305830]